MADILASLPPQCFEAAETWRAETVLICWELVEHYHPVRVLRQFRMVQHIPANVTYQEDLHQTGQRGQAGKDWSAHHRFHIESWADRRAHIVDAAPGIYCQPGYDVWFRSVTRWRIGRQAPPMSYPGGYQGAGSSATVLYEACHRSMVLAGDVLHLADGPIREALGSIRLTCSRALGSSGFDPDQMGQPPITATAMSQQQGPSMSQPKAHIDGRSDRGRRRGGRRPRAARFPEAPGAEGPDVGGPEAPAHAFPDVAVVPYVSSSYHPGSTSGDAFDSFVSSEDSEELMFDPSCLSPMCVPSGEGPSGGFGVGQEAEPTPGVVTQLEPDFSEDEEEPLIRRRRRAVPTEQFPAPGLARDRPRRTRRPPRGCGTH